jgi:hypothetical protein
MRGTWTMSVTAVQHGPLVMAPINAECLVLLPHLSLSCCYYFYILSSCAVCEGCPGPRRCLPGAISLRAVRLTCKCWQLHKVGHLADVSHCSLTRPCSPRPTVAERLALLPPPLESLLLLCLAQTCEGCGADAMAVWQLPAANRDSVFPCLLADR